MLVCFSTYILYVLSRQSLCTFHFNCCLSAVSLIHISYTIEQVVSDVWPKDTLTNASSYISQNPICIRPSWQQDGFLSLHLCRHYSFTTLSLNITWRSALYTNEMRHFILSCAYTTGLCVGIQTALAIHWQQHQKTSLLFVNQHLSL